MDFVIIHLLYFWPQFSLFLDDPGGAPDLSLATSKARLNSIILHRTNGINVEYLRKSTASSAPTTVTLSNVTPAASSAPHPHDPNNHKYLHKKFKRIASATLDSSHKIAADAAGLLNNNSDVLNKNSFLGHSAASIPSHEVKISANSNLASRNHYQPSSKDASGSQVFNQQVRVKL